MQDPQERGEPFVGGIARISKNKLRLVIFDSRLMRAFAIAILLFVYLLTPSGVINNGDGAARYAQTKALLLRHSLAIPSDIANGKDGSLIGGILLAPNGKFYSKFGLGISIIWLLPMSFAWVIHRVTHIDLDLLAGFGISFVNPTLVVMTAWSMMRITATLGIEVRVRLWMVILYFFGASTLAYANSAFSEPVTALMILWAVAIPIMWDGARAGLVSGLLLTFCTLIKPEFAPLPACLLPLFWRRPKHFTFFSISAAAGGIFIAMNNLLIRGSIFRFSYGSETSQFQLPIRGLVQYFFGLNRNLVLFNPALVLAVIGWLTIRNCRRWRRMLWACLLIWAVYLPFYASWWAWSGGTCFGPRFFQSFIPITFLPCGVGLCWLTTNARRQSWAGVVCVVLTGLVIVLVPLQIAGLEIKNEEAAHVADGTNLSEPWVNVELLAIKLWRGVRAPEVYHKSDFTKLAKGEKDLVFDYRAKRTFQYLNHWWAIYIANKMRHTRSDIIP